MFFKNILGLLIFGFYYLISVIFVFSMKKTFKISSELWRKSLHLICVLSIFIVLNIFNEWFKAMLLPILFSLIVYPILLIAEKHPKYSDFFCERKPGELKLSLVLVSFVFSTLIFVFWGIFGESQKHIIIISILTWGFGDAAAALIGKKYGKHHLEYPLIDSKKTVEGTLAMLVMSAIVILITTLIFTSLPLYYCFVITLFIAPISSIVELFSHHGLDTLTVPFSVAVSTFLLLSLFTL